MDHPLVQPLRRSRFFFVGCICLSSEVFLYLKLTLEFGFFDWLEYVIARFV